MDEILKFFFRDEVLLAWITLLISLVSSLFLIKFNKRLQRVRKVKKEIQYAAESSDEGISTSGIIDNLPAFSRNFVGRSAENRLIRKIIRTDSSTNIIGIYGPAGVGKTSLLLQIGYECKKKKAFDLIVFIPTRDYCNSDKYTEQGSLGEKIILTATYLLHFKGTNLSPFERVAFFRAYLAKSRTLILIDGIDEIGEEQQTNLLSFLSGLPKQTKVIVTSRNKLPIEFPVFELESLTYHEFLTLIDDRHTFEGEKTEEELRKLFHLAGGDPLIVKLICFVYKTESLCTVLEKLSKNRNTVLEDILDETFDALNSSSRFLLFELAEFPSLATFEDFEDDFLGSLNILLSLGLVIKNLDGYSVNPFVMNYIRSRQSRPHWIDQNSD